ncbi:MAG: hypothetical protein UY71_C0032G0006 [Parcubacteria group bacterium GW2011_GWB1_52_7]|nr:MAG: hypothetical protein UY64_C0033G0005 [Parcubacteria group bacterium GW2011_GWA1_51_12]KKW28125.1 MAG: hypothetical protein UY71_C0032G0006 [Parcubacteria group bacterium GW2011_GWB1_52_7]KKW31499.1 MAG: hypothetical protein UY75_C0006G0008 [Parcubacteria group bacterium GW2011_GWC2_52_8c]
MRFILISIFTVFFAVGALVILVSRTVVPPMVEAEKRELVGILPLMRSAVKLVLASPAPDAGLQKIKNLSGLDVTIVSTAGVIRQTTLEGGRLRGSKLSVGERSATVFEMVSVAAAPSFIVSTPLALDFSPLGESDVREFQLVISKPDKLIGRFFDELFTNVVLVGLLGIAVSIPIGLYQRRRLKPARFNLAPISDALSAIAKKDFSYRMRENVGDDSFRRAQSAFNRYMEEMSQESARLSQAARGTVPPTAPEHPAKTPVGAAEIAFQAALGSIEEGIVIVEQSGKITAFNRKMEELTGMDADVVVRKSLTNVLAFVHKNGEEVTGIIPRILSTGISEVFPEDLMLRRRDGAFVPVAVKTVAIRKDLRGAVTHLVVVVNAKAAPSAKPVVIEKKLRSKIIEDAQAEAKRQSHFPPADIAAPSVRPADQVISKTAAAARVPEATHKDLEQLPMAVSAKLPAVVSEKPAAAAGDASHAAPQKYEEDSEDYGAPPPNLPT